MTPVARRPATEADGPFQHRLFASTREEELALTPWSSEEKAAFIAQQFRAQSTHYAQHYADASFEIVLVEGRPAGRLIVQRDDREMRVVDIALLPEFRGDGIGAALLGGLLEEADRSGRVVALHVEHANPARRLYERLGFAVVADEGIHLALERQPKTAS